MKNYEIFYTNQAANRKLQPQNENQAKIIDYTCIRMAKIMEEEPKREPRLVVYDENREAVWSYKEWRICQALAKKLPNSANSIPEYANNMPSYYYFL